jgi:hypothetical protein
MQRIDAGVSALTPMFAFTDGDRWRPGIGDPTFGGWFTVIAYFVAAYFCWRAAGNSLYGRKVRWFWNGLAVLLILLGINKQLDFQTELTFLGRDFAKATGWYEERHIVQAIFIVCIAVGGIVTMSALFWVYRFELRRLWPALAGVAFLMSFIVIRAASFHHVDQFLRFAPAGLRMNWLLELGGIAAIAWPAWRAWKQSSARGFVWVTGGGARGPGQPAMAASRSKAR